ncbi:MAG TPA: valine--tRNA ligase [Firmicutes bacterium]|nr:valine--tRNA ligase [Bacillota bacterium]
METTTATSAGRSQEAFGLPKAYDPREIEPRWYDFWLRERLFSAEVDPNREPFSMVIPPPNVTGQLHMGHALDNTMQDILVRWERMRGKNAVWIPGTDHAGIATQIRVEEELAKEGKTRYDLGREAFLERVWAWKEHYGHRIIQQLQRLGSSCDWNRERFTMDEGCSRAVREVFVRLYEKGLIYQGDYIINCCPRCRTALSDIEVEHEESDGSLYYIRYPLLPSSSPAAASSSAAAQTGEFIVVATTRPETMLGDTGIAVHPQDERYRGLVGRRALLPLVGRELPVFADEYVDPEFGTGAVKVTPAHDPNDFDMGRRHALEMVKVIDEDARMTDAVPVPYRGLSREECRRRVVADLEAQGYLVKVEPLRHAVGHCSRCGTVVEPLVSQQWFVRMRPLAEPALAAVREGRVRFVPERFTTLFLNWVENVRDWCISRQLWWGHRIPVWYCDRCGHRWAATDDPEECPRCGARGSEIRQDPDVLDTWFSSALWPFSTLGWPEQTPELEHWYPTTLLVTGFDIIFFWVARMVFMGLEFMGDVPFRTVLIHGLVRDALGRKMSKSLGNGIDPIDVIEEYGADALRFTLVNGVGPGNDMRYVPERVEASRNFANKVWNATRFALLNLEGFSPELPAIPGTSGTVARMAGWVAAHRKDLSLADRWILSRWSRAARELTHHLEEYDLGEAARELYDFIWDELCDWYIEMSKPRLYGAPGPAREATRQVLWFVLRSTLEMLHPFMPFVTEELWQRLPDPPGPGEGSGDGGAGGPPSQRRVRSIMIQPWPTADPRLIDEEAEREVGLLREVIGAIRNLRAELQVAPGRKIRALFYGSEPSLRTLGDSPELMQQLAGLDPEGVEMHDTGAARPHQALAVVAGGVEIYLPLAGMVDLAAEKARLEKELAQARTEAERSARRLADERFVAKAPPSVVEREKERLARYEEIKAKLAARLALLAGVTGPEAGDGAGAEGCRS